MKDRQVQAPSVEPSIFLLSPLLHCVSMTVLVYLRSSFGYAFLRPKSVFLALSWALLLYAIYAWVEGTVWWEHRALLWFGIGAASLYCLHLFLTMSREWRGVAVNDADSGISHFVRVTSPFSSVKSAGSGLRIWAEPALVTIFAFLLRVVAGPNGLSSWLLFAALCLLGKEAINHWFRQRRRKRRGDILEDAGEDFEEQGSTAAPPLEPPAPGARKTKVHRSRAHSNSKGDEECRRYEEILRLLPPYDLTMAEANYHRLIKADHPDVSAGSEESTRRTQD